METSLPTPTSARVILLKVWRDEHSLADPGQMIRGWSISPRDKLGDFPTGSQTILPSFIFTTKVGQLVLQLDILEMCSVSHNPGKRVINSHYLRFCFVHSGWPNNNTSSRHPQVLILGPPLNYTMRLVDVLIASHLLDTSITICLQYPTNHLKSS